MSQTTEGQSNMFFVCFAGFNTCKNAQYSRLSFTLSRISTTKYIPKGHAQKQYVCVYISVTVSSVFVEDLLFRSFSLAVGSLDFVLVEGNLVGDSCRVEGGSEEPGIKSRMAYRQLGFSISMVVLQWWNVPNISIINFRTLKKNHSQSHSFICLFIYLFIYLFIAEMDFRRKRNHFVTN